MIVRRSFALAWVLGLSGIVCLAQGCLAESHSPSSPVALEDFCGRFFDALCGPLDGCGCGLVASTSCRAEERMICGSFLSTALQDAIADGSLRYDPDAAAALLSRLEERGCDGFVQALDWRVRDLFDLGGVFVGDRAVGERCESLGFELVSVCRLGSCSSGSGGGVCRGSVGEGERCDRTHRCVDLDRDLSLGGSVEQWVLRCEPDTPGSDAGTCRRWVDEGAACAEPVVCWTGRCEGGVCAAAEVAGECLSTRECAAGLYCQNLACALGGAPEGAPCDDAAACASEVCVGGRCLARGCDTF